MAEQLYTKAYATEIEEDGKKVKLFVASDEVEDRQGEIISADGWRIDNFKNNPVLLWGHDQYRPSIGIADKIGYKTINGSKKLVFEPKFHRKDEFSRLIADLVEEGWLKASSVGFMPLEQQDNKYLKQELLEISFVNVPANPNALSLALAKGYSMKTIKMVMPEIKEEKEEDKAVIPYKKYPLADEDVDWDAGAEVKAASVEDLKKMCAWYDADNSDVKGSYKLPHHTVSGYKTVWRGCAAAMAAMMGARGGVDIPEADRQGVYNHLVKHYKDFDKEPPMMRQADEIVDRYVANRSPDDQIVDLTRTVNLLVEELRVEREEKQQIAQKNTDDFKKHLEKRFEDITLNLQGLAEGINPGEGLEQRFKNLEENLNDLAQGVQALAGQITSQKGPNESGGLGREPRQSPDSSDDDSRRRAKKALNRIIDVLNRLEK